MRTGYAYGTALLLAIALSGCTTPAADDAGGNATPSTESTAAGAALDSTATSVPIPPTDPDLTGTSWQLVEIQSMDDRTYTPDDRSKYTISFGADGRSSIRADCNQGSATWASPEKNALQFGPVVMTKMMCPPGSLYDRFVGGLEHVRTYTMRAGNLYLSLMADGGIYQFEPRR